MFFFLFTYDLINNYVRTIKYCFTTMFMTMRDKYIYCNQ